MDYLSCESIYINTAPANPGLFLEDPQRVGEDLHGREGQWPLVLRRRRRRRRCAVGAGGDGVGVVLGHLGVDLVVWEVVQSRCSGCVEAEAGTCIEAKVSISVREWRKLVEAQKKIEEREEQLLTELLRLWEQKRLLRERAGEFFGQDCEEIQELEELEKERKQREEEKDQERECQGILRRHPRMISLVPPRSTKTPQSMHLHR
jgi:hypothetical protein